MFSPHPNLADEVNRSIIQSEIEGGVYLGDLPPSTVLANSNSESLLHRSASGRQRSAALRPSRVLSPARPSRYRRFHLGRLDAQASIRRPRHAPRIPPSPVPHSHHHLRHPGNPRLSIGVARSPRRGLRAKRFYVGTPAPGCPPSEARQVLIYVFHASARGRVQRYSVDPTTAACI